MVEQQLRSLGLRLRAPARPPTSDGVRRPTGRPPAARPGWEEHLVAQKPVGEPWPAEARGRIAKARAYYEAGTHEMVSCTTPDGWTQLYCRPRRAPTARRSYFNAQPGVA